jgi:D-alanyl-D-alanine carboxypeptidase
MAEEYLPLLLETVPINNAADSSRYGLGVAVNTSEQFGLVYGHAGWIPGYVSSLRYYPEVGVAEAFQINSDVSINDNPNILNQIETRLINTLLGNGRDRFK